MHKTTSGIVTAVSKQWWLKVNTQSVRVLGSDGAVYPHIIKVRYTVDGTVYAKRRWLGPGRPVPALGASVQVSYDENKPKKAKIL